MGGMMKSYPEKNSMVTILKAPNELYYTRGRQARVKKVYWEESVRKIVVEVYLKMNMGNYYRGPLWFYKRELRK